MRLHEPHVRLSTAPRCKRPGNGIERAHLSAGAAAVDAVPLEGAAAEPPADAAGGAAAPVDGAALCSATRARLVTRVVGVSCAAFAGLSRRRDADGMLHERAQAVGG